MLASFPKVPNTLHPIALKIDVFDHPTVVCTLSPGNPHKCPHNLILTETRVIGLSLSLIVWVYLHSNVRGGLRKTHVVETECIMALQCHPSSLIWAPIESMYATSY